MKFWFWFYYISPGIVKNIINKLPGRGKPGLVQPGELEQQLVVGEGSVLDLHVVGEHLIALGQHSGPAQQALHGHHFSLE